MAFSASSAMMLAPCYLLWPQDVLADFAAGQRSGPAVHAARSIEDSGPLTVTGTHSNVVALPVGRRRG